MFQFLLVLLFPLFLVFDLVR